MSKLKLLFVIFIIQAALLLLGYFSLISRASTDSSITEFYVTEFMIGYSLPVIVAGLFVFSSFLIVYKKPKKVFRKITITDPAIVSHQIPAYGNS